MAAPEMELDYVPTNGKAKFKNWIPKKWRPEYERVVMMSATGMSNRAIANKVGFTKEHVSNILNLPYAEKLMERIVQAMNTRAMTDIPAGLNRIAEKTVSRLESVLNDDNLFKESPFAIIDRGMEVLKGLQHLKGGGNGSPTQNINSAIILSGAAADNFVDGLRKADEVKQIHSGDGK